MKPGSDPSQTPIAIIGMACIFPQAPDLRTFWNNVLGGVDAIGEPVPDWGAERYLAAGRIKTQRGGFLKDLYRFDPREFGISPTRWTVARPTSTWSWWWRATRCWTPVKPARGRTTARPASCWATAPTCTGVRSR